MNKQQVVFRTAQVGFGLAHIGLQSLADGFQYLADQTVEAEASVVKRVGYWEGGKQVQLSESELDQYKVQRVTHTRELQKNYKERTQFLKDKLLKTKSKTTITEVK